MPFDESAESELLVTEQAGGGHGVENFAGNKMKCFAEHAQVVVRSVEDQFAIAQRIEQGADVQAGERIDQKIAGFQTELQQAELLGIGVETIGFGIDSNPGRAPDCCDNRVQVLRIRNHPMQTSANSGDLEA